MLSKLESRTFEDLYPLFCQQNSSPLLISDIASSQKSPPSMLVAAAAGLAAAAGAAATAAAGAAATAAGAAVATGVAATVVVAGAAAAGTAGTDGRAGTAGTPGTAGRAGTDGRAGTAGRAGTDGRADVKLPKNYEVFLRRTPSELAAISATDINVLYIFFFSIMTVFNFNLFCQVAKVF